MYKSKLYVEFCHSEVKKMKMVIPNKMPKWHMEVEERQAVRGVYKWCI